MKQGSRQSGVTLIELMVSIAVLAIILFIGVPSFQSTLESSRARAITNDLAGALQLARSEALKRRVNVSVCISNQDQDGCDSTGDWNDGWLIVTEDGNVIRIWDAIPVIVNGNGITSTSDEIVFTRTGFSKNLDEHLITIDVVNHVRCMNINRIGQLSVSIKGAGACS